MQFLSFILIYPIIWLLSILPFRVLYSFSDGMYYLFYYLIGYRKKTVLGNLKLAFPEKSEKEIISLSKKFYRHFTDIFTEMLKSFTISEKEIVKRYKFTNTEVLHELEKKNRSVILLGGHYANWEWMFSLNLNIKSKGLGVYKKLKNPYFDKKVRETRGRYRSTLVPTYEVFSIIKDNYEQNVLSMYGFLGDQSPKINKAQYWSEFMGVKVPIHTGAEVLSKKYDLPIVIFTTKKIKRGYYEITFTLTDENPNTIKDFKITDMFLRTLEKQIRETPEHYFWSHKRFKHMDKAPN